MLRKLFSNVSARACSRFAGFPFFLFAVLVWNAAAVHAADINVGPGRTLKTLQAGVAAAKANDTIVLDAGVYLDDVATIDKPLTIESAGRGAVLRITKPISNRKGILVVNADLTVRKITFEGAHVTDEDGKNGAGIRHQAGDLVVDTCVFRNNQNGILANGNRDASVTIRRSAFLGNGAGDGYTHGIYINAVARLTVDGSTFSGTKVGHNIKSRALKTTITDTSLDDGVTGTPSYAIDLPNGGDVLIRNVRITQGQETSNTGMIAYGAEKNLHEGSSLTIVGSTFANRAQNSTALINFTSITAIFRDNTFDNIGEITKGLMQMNRSTVPALHEGAVFSGLDPNARSYLRFHNTGVSYGHVDVSVFDSRDGRSLGTWTSPNIPPNAAPQFSITTLEEALQVTDLPATYSIAITSAMTGTFQHVLHRAASGVITNLTTCDAGVARAGPQLGSVHTSNLDNGYPASIMVRNLGPMAGVAQIGIYDARQGDRLGGYTTAEISVDGGLIIPMAILEAVAQVAPTWEMGHWVLKIENDFPGTLQQLIANLAPAVITDMTTVCALNGAGGDSESVLGVGAVFAPSAEIESTLRVHNTGAVPASLRVRVYDALSGDRLGHWESPAIPSHATRQFSVSSLVPPVAEDQTAPRFYRLSIESGFPGFVQNLMRHTGHGALTNLSSCDDGTTASVADIAGLRSSNTENSDLELLVLSNSGPTDAPAQLEAFDALDGSALGSFSTMPVPGHGNIALTAGDVETGLGLTPGSGIGSYNIRLKDDFAGALQHVLINPQTGTVTDMTTACAVGPQNG